VSTPQGLFRAGIACLFLLAGGGRLSAASRQVPEDLPAKYRAWVEEVDLLLSLFVPK
jgi:hypothetical protein